MARYHLNLDTGESGACRAKIKCPFGDLTSDHFESKKEAMQNYEQRQEFFAAVEKEPKRELSKITTQAFLSKMHYRGSLPSWALKEQRASMFQREIFSSETEYLDVLETASGKVLVSYDRQSMDPRDVFNGLEMGIRISKLSYRDFNTGEEVAYLKTSQVDRAILQAAFGTTEDWPLFYMAERQSSLSEMIQTEYPESKAKYTLGDDPRKYARVLSNSASDPKLSNAERIERKIELREQMISELPSEVSENIDWRALKSDEQSVNADISEMSSKLKDFIIKQNSGHRIPFIDYSKVSDKLRGQGIGQSLYVYSARKLAEQGSALRGSSIQTEEAKRVWSRMAANPGFNIDLQNVVNSYSGSVGVYPVMDFRK